MLTGQNGILNRASEAKIKNQQSQQEEENSLNDMETLIANYAGLKNIDLNNTNPLGIVPKGATIIEDDASKGIVIKDKNNNEWVWVEVPKNKTFSGISIDLTKELTEQNYKDIEDRMIEYASTYREGKKGQGCDYKDEWYEGCGLSKEEYNNAYHSMLKSVYNYGGFWIGRYETGIEGSVTDITKVRNSHSDLGTGKAIIQKNAIPYNYIYCSEAQTLANNLMQNDNYISSLMFGIQWDLVCKYLEEETDLTEKDINFDSSKWGNYSDAKIENIKMGKYNVLDSKTYKLGTWSNIDNPLTKENTGDYKWIFIGTGISEYTNRKNIYDFAGNAWEWTLEKSSNDESPCVSRGGYFYYVGNDGPASYRGASGVNGSDYHFSFRATFYEK